MIKVTLCALACLATVSLNAAVLYAPTPIGSSARFSDYGSTDETGFRALDNFTLASGGRVERVSWSGFWLDQIQPAPAPAPDVDTWEIAFYADNAGAPGAQLWLESIAPVDVSSTFLGTGVFSVNGLYNVSFYNYSVDLPSFFNAAAGTQYWVSILAGADTFRPSFALRGATGGDDSSWQQVLGAGMSVVSGNAVARDRAIVLEGTVPEPGTWLITAAGLLALPAIRRARLRGKGPSEPRA